MSASRTLAVIVALSASAPSTAEQPCPRQPLPPALQSAGFRADPLSLDEVILFSAEPSFQPVAYAVRISRSGTAPATFHLVRLVRQRDCNRYDRLREWRISLGRTDTARLFAEIALLERDWRRDDGIALDGTGFRFEHHRGGRVTMLQPSPSAQGQSGRLSSLILSLARRTASEDLPITPDWRTPR